MTDQQPGVHAQRSRVRSQQDLGAGLFLITIALFAAWQAFNLPLGTLRSMGPGMLPMSLSVLLALGGIGLVVSSLMEDGPELEAWSLRGLLFIVGGVVVFAFLIQSVGLLVAGPVSMMIGSLASDEFRWKEALIFSISLTIVCVLLFKSALGLPIPVLVGWW